MPQRPLTSLRRTLLVRSIVSASLPVILLGLFSVGISGFILFNAIENRNQTIIHQGALQVEKHIATLEKDIRLLAKDISLGIDAQSHLKKFIELHPEYSTVWITDSVGTVIASSPEGYNLMGLDKSRSEAFLHSKGTKDVTHFSNTSISYELQEPVVTISYPLEKGIIALEYRTGELSSYIAEVAESQGFYLVLTDKIGTWIAHPEGQKVQQREQDPNRTYLNGLAAGENRDSMWLRFQGELSSYFMEKNDQAGWMVTIYQPVSVLFAPLSLLFGVLLLLGFALIVASIMQAWSTINKTITPIEHFISAASTVSKGEYNLRLPEVSFTEFATLKEAFEAMVQSLDMREKEQKELWEQLIQSQKMEVIGALAGGIAHDFNNILTAIGGFSQLLKTGLKKGSNEEKYADEIHNSVIRASALTRQLLTFSRKEEVEVTEVEVISCVSSMMNMLRRIVGEDITLVLDKKCDKGFIKADKHHIEQVLLNLAVNAADALREHAITAPMISIVIDGDKEHILISVIDNGKGIPEEIVDKIFEPFFTTKDAGKGTGMGLSTVKGIVEQHNATITVDSTAEGTTITTIWPVCEETSTITTEENRQQKVRDLSIILVDDEPILREIAEIMLEKLHHKVQTAKDGKEVLDLLESEGESIDMVITDMIMPGGISGDMLAKEIRDRWSRIKILFLSGYTDNHLEQTGFKKDDVHFLSKPFRIEQLQQAIEKHYE